MKYPKTMGELPLVRSPACTQEVMSLAAYQGHTLVKSKLASHLNAQAQYQESILDSLITCILYMNLHDY